MLPRSSSKKDILFLSLLIAIALVLFYPVFYSTYFYTDEVVGLWQFGKVQDEHTLLQYGRLITEKLAVWLFGSINRVDQLHYIRIFSLAGWLLSIPIWYYVIKRVVIKERLPGILVFFSVLYLVCTPTFAISIGWAACFELFLANTAGLLSGYLMYAAIGYEDNRVKVSSVKFLLSLAMGVISLFTYQNGFGCFLIPFLLHLFSATKISRRFIIGIAGYLFIFLLYYLLFKYSLRVYHIGLAERTSFNTNPLEKVGFFLTKPLPAAFHLTWLFNEKNISGRVVFAIVFIACMVAGFLQKKNFGVPARLKYLATVFSLFILAYLPSFIARENYASNRTMLALKMCVFFFIAYTIIVSLARHRAKRLVIAVSVLFFANAWYNFNQQFLSPVKSEYLAMRRFISDNYQKDSIHTFHFIRPAEDFFEHKYSITRSWDEFGVPSGFFNWVPEYFTRQLVFEKTSSRETSNRLVIKSWLGMKAYLQSGEKAGPGTLVIDTEKILNGEK